MATIEDIDKRLLALEVNHGILGKTTDLENRVRDLESMVRTARYFVTVSAALITIVGIGVTAYVAWLTSRVEDAKSQVQATRTFIENTKSEADKTQTTISAQQAQATELKNTFDGLTQKAIADLKKAGADVVAGAVSVILSPIAADVQQLKETLYSSITRLKDLEKPSTLSILSPGKPGFRSNICQQYSKNFDRHCQLL